MHFTKPLAFFINLAINTANVEPFSTMFTITLHCRSPIIWASAVPENIYTRQSSCMFRFFLHGLLEIAPFSVFLNNTLNVFSLGTGYTQKHWDSGHVPGWYNRQLQISHIQLLLQAFLLHGWGNHPGYSQAMA